MRFIASENGRGDLAVCQYQLQRNTVRVPKVIVAILSGHIRESLSEEGLYLWVSSSALERLAEILASVGAVGSRECLGIKRVDDRRRLTQLHMLSQRFGFGSPSVFLEIGLAALAALLVRITLLRQGRVHRGRRRQKASARRMGFEIVDRGGTALLLHTPLQNRREIEGIVLHHCAGNRFLRRDNNPPLRTR